MKKEQQYIPAARFDFLTRFYDPLVRITTREKTFKRALLDQAKLENGQTILDLACGTGTLSIAIKKTFPQSDLIALDADHEVLAIAREKAAANATDITFDQGFSDALPYSDGQFDRVFSTLAFHHLTLEAKINTICEIVRVLKPDGEFHLADFGLPSGKTQSVLSNFIRKFDGAESTRDNFAGRLGLLMEQNGFGMIERTQYFKTVLGTIRLYRAMK